MDGGHPCLQLGGKNTGHLPVPTGRWQLIAREQKRDYIFTLRRWLQSDSCQRWFLTESSDCQEVSERLSKKILIILWLRVCIYGSKFWMKSLFSHIACCRRAILVAHAGASLTKLRFAGPATGVIWPFESKVTKRVRNEVLSTGGPKSPKRS